MMDKNENRRQSQKIVQKSSHNYIYIRVWTWQKDSYSLFDYSEQDIHDSRKKVYKEYELNAKLKNLYILRSNKNSETIIISNQLQQQPSKYNLISHIKIAPNHQKKKLQFTFLPPKLQHNNKKYQNAHECQSPKKNKQVRLQYPSIVVSKQIDSNKEVKGCVLNPGDVVVFGRVKYLVREVKLNGSVRKYVEKGAGYENAGREYKQEEYGDQELEETNMDKQSAGSEEQSSPSRSLSKSPNKLHSKQQKQQKMSQTQNRTSKQQQPQKLQCRICMDSSSTQQDKLISVCKCTGSCKYIHFKCLKTWIQTKAVISNRQWCTIIDRINCQICKSQIPISINLGQHNTDKNMELVLIQKPANTDYLILQKINANTKNIVILKNIPYQGISFGRSAGSYVKVDDISVSKVHAFIKYNKGEFCVYDHHSKFGTQVMQGQDTRKQEGGGDNGHGHGDGDGECLLRLDIGKNQRFVQIGRTLMGIVIKKKEGILANI